MRSTYFISDLHLSLEQEGLNSLFIQFLNHLTGQDPMPDALYILGDLFDAWIGDWDEAPYNNPAIQKLVEVSGKMPVYFLHGNRDFLIGPHFSKKTGIRLLPEYTELDLYGIRCLLMHGDQLCTADHAYQRLRRVVRQGWLQRLFLAAPLFFRKWIACLLRKKPSVNSVPDEATRQKWDATPGAIDKIFAKFNSQWLIHGHTHRPEVHTLSSGKTRVVLGDWGETGARILKVQANQQLELFHFQG